MNFSKFFKSSLFFFFLTVLLIACKNDTSVSSTEATNQQSAHPAQNQENRTPIKIDARGGSVGDQINQQAIADERQKRAQHLNTGGLQWTTFDKIAREGGNNGKKYFVDVYTEWCGWCKVMDKKTFTDPEVQKYLKENFNIVKFDAEQKETVKFKGKEYEWVNGGRKGINRLALELLGNRMSYPTMVYLDENMNKIVAAPGYKKPDELLIELKKIVKG